MKNIMEHPEKYLSVKEKQMYDYVNGKNGQMTAVNISNPKEQLEAEQLAALATVFHPLTNMNNEEAINMTKQCYLDV